MHKKPTFPMVAYIDKVNEPYGTIHVLDESRPFFVMVFSVEKI
ncbi:hypothetical protein AAK27_725 [Mycoplasma capricolum subsp. capricolum]|nr:hypothetical protein AAK27_725 [Mycoplasma capricolum subsp. capricolum]